MNKLLSTLLSICIVVGLAIPTFSQQVRQAGVQRIDSDAMMERLQQSLEDRFDEVDEDEDGSLTKEEFKKLMSQDRSSSRTPSIQRSRSASGSRTATTATSATNTRDESEVQRKRLLDEEAQKEREKELEEQFDKFDENEDGKLSKDEYLDAQEKTLRDRMDRPREQRGRGERQGGQRQGSPMPPQRSP